MATIEEIYHQLEEYLSVTHSVPVETHLAMGRVIAEDVIAHGVFPPKTMVNVEGYALKMTDLIEIPTTLVEIGQAHPSTPFEGEIQKGEAVAVFPNAILPDGADMVITKEYVEKDHESIMIKEHIPLTTTISPGGIDVSDKQVILKKGTILNARHLALASVLRTRWLPVHHRPNIGIMTYHPTIQGFQETHNINNISAQVAIGIFSMIEACGANPIMIGESHENYTSYESQHFNHDLKLAITGMDMIIGIGGVSRADRCPMWQSLQSLDADIMQHDIGIGLGQKLVTGHTESLSILGLPSNPVASMVCAEIILRPLINRMLGVNTPLSSYRDIAILSHNLDSYDRKCDYIYGYLKRDEHGKLHVTPNSTQDVLMLTELCDADCIMYVDKKRELTSGTAVEIIRIGGKMRHIE